MLSKPSVPLVVALLGTWAVVLWGWPFTVDDAFITWRYAARLASGAGYTFNDGPATDGVTGPLWLFGLALVHWLGCDVGLAAKAGGALAVSAAVGLVVVRAGRGSCGRCAGWGVALTCTTSLPMLAWAAAGLETGLATLAATTLALAVTARPRPQASLAGASVAALAWLRPELAGWCAGWLLVLGWRRPPGLRNAGLWALPGVAALLTFRRAMFDHWLPLSAHAKPGSFGHGLTYLLDAAVRPRVLVLLPWLWPCRRDGDRMARQLWAPLCLHGACVWLAGGDWMPAARLFAPVVPVVALVVGRALARRGLWVRGTRWAAVMAAWAALSLTVRAGDVLMEMQAVRQAGELRARRVAAFAARLGSRGGPIAMVDIGALGDRLPARSFIDLAGLTEPALAYAPGGHLSKQVDPVWLARRAPALLVLHSRDRPRFDAAGRLRWFNGYPVERRVLAMPWVRRGYRIADVFEYAPDYYYLVLTRKGADLPRQ